MGIGSSMHADVAQEAVDEVVFEPGSVRIHVVSCNVGSHEAIIRRAQGAVKQGAGDAGVAASGMAPCRNTYVGRTA